MLDKYKGRKASIGDYDPKFRNLLYLGQNMHLELFTTRFSIGYFSLIRCPEWSNHGGGEKNMDTAAIKLINKRRKREVARGIETVLSM